MKLPWTSGTSIRCTGKRVVVVAGQGDSDNFHRGPRSEGSRKSLTDDDAPSSRALNVIDIMDLNIFSRTLG